MGMTELRAFQPNDIDSLLLLFRETIHQINAVDYSLEQIVAWAPDQPDKDDWIQRLSNQFTQLAFVDQKLVGFGSLSKKGLIDFIYVHHEHQREGIAQLIYTRLEFEARQMRMDRLHTEASITARKFFEKMKFEIVFPQEKAIRGVILKNYVMEKFLV
jgi:putative acetyltransferase